LNQANEQPHEGKHCDDDAAALFLAAAHPENDEPGDQDEHPAGACRGLCEEHRDGDADEAEADERPGPVAALGEHLLRERLVAPFLRDDEHGGEVDEDPRAAEQREDDEPEPEDGGTEAEVASKTAADAGDDPRRLRALEALDLGCGCDVCVHVYEAACKRLRWLSGNTLVRPSTLLSTFHGRETDRREPSCAVRL
jgi:hypothetical protein